MTVRYTAIEGMEEPALRDVDRNAERWRDKIELRLDNRQVFFLFFGSAVVACMLFVLGVMVGKRIESRGQAASPELQDPLAALDRAHKPVAGVAPAPAPQLTFPNTLIAPPREAREGGEARVDGAGAEAGARAPRRPSRSRRPLPRRDRPSPSRSSRGAQGGRSAAAAQADRAGRGGAAPGRSRRRPRRPSRRRDAGAGAQAGRCDRRPRMPRRRRGSSRCTSARSRPPTRRTRSRSATRARSSSAATSRGAA